MVLLNHKSMTLKLLMQVASDQREPREPQEMMVNQEQMAPQETEEQKDQLDQQDQKETLDQKVNSLINNNILVLNFALKNV